MIRASSPFPKRRFRASPECLPSYVVKDNVVRQQTVEVGLKTGKLVEVLSGLKGDEIIAASNLNQLVTGVRIAANSGEEAGSASDEGGTPSNRPRAGERGGRGRGGRREGESETR